MSCKLIFVEVVKSYYNYFSVPAEHVVITKERRSGSYHLSAYYLAKTLSELPLVIILPSIFHIVTYWCIGLNGLSPFFATWFVILVNAIVSQVCLLWSLH